MTVNNVNTELRSEDLKQKIYRQLMSECTEEKLKAINAAIKTYRGRSEQLYTDTVHWLEVLSAFLDLVSKSNNIELIKEPDVNFDVVVGVGGAPLLNAKSASRISLRMDVLGKILNDGSYKYKVLSNILGCDYTEYIGKYVKVTITGRSKTEVLRGKLTMGSSRYDYLKLILRKKDGTLGKTIRVLYDLSKVNIELDEDTESGV